MPFDVPLADGEVLHLGQHACVMGILNVTPDSFSDGGDHIAIETALGAARQMVAEGAQIIDIGGESTRPGHEEVGVQQELDRVMPVLEGLAQEPVDALISIDTRKPVVAHQALEMGAHIVNDVMGLQGEPEMADVAAAFEAPVIAMHWDTERDRKKDVLEEIKRFFSRTIEIAEKAGIARKKLILDPGFGFAKDLAENYEILRRLHELSELGVPLLVGTSRKSMIGKVLDNEPKERGAGTIATSVLGYMGGGHIFRVHEVRPNRDALSIAEATLYGPGGSAA